MDCRKELATFQAQEVGPAVGVEIRRETFIARVEYLRVHAALVPASRKAGRSADPDMPLAGVVGVARDVRAAIAVVVTGEALAPDRPIGREYRSRAGRLCERPSARLARIFHLVGGKRSGGLPSRGGRPICVTVLRGIAPAVAERS
jgi:hypothetical protein